MDNKKCPVEFFKLLLQKRNENIISEGPFLLQISFGKIEILKVGRRMFHQILIRCQLGARNLQMKLNSISQIIKLSIIQTVLV